MNATRKPAPALAAKRPWSQFAALFVVAVLVAAAFFFGEWDFTVLTDPEKAGKALERVKGLILAFASPDLSGDFVATSWDLTLQTLAAASVGTALAVIAGYLLALGASRAVCVGEEGQGGWRRQFPLRSPMALLCSMCRLIVDVLRAVPDFAWAVILVAMLGLGPLTGALALSLNVAGILGKVYSELWDSVPEREYEQVRTLGAGRLNTFLYGIRPLASRSVQSFTLMRAECAIRNAAVIGAVGGGGLGSEIMHQIGMGAWSKVTTLIFFTLLLTLSADLGSNFIRRQLRSDPNHPCAARNSGTFAGMMRGYVGVGFATVVVIGSLWFMGWGNSAGPDGQARNFLEPAGELISGKAWKNLEFFEKLLLPDLNLEAIGVVNPMGSPEDVEASAHNVRELREQGRNVQVFADYGPERLLEWEAWRAWDEQLGKWFVWRVARSAVVPLSIAIVGTLLGVLAAIALTYPHSLAFMLESSQFTGESPHALMRAARVIQLVLARTVGLLSRGIPEIMWAFLFMAFFGPGLLAGAAAIAVHTCGVLVRVFSETVDNIPYRRFEQGFMGSRVACFTYVGAPSSWRDWMTYSFFQFEANVRAAVVLGIVGIGGLGFFFTFNFEWFRFEKASTHLLMIIALTVIIDRTSRLLKLSRV